MKIAFDKISHTPKDVEVHYQGVVLVGELCRERKNEVRLNASLKGEKKCLCDRCGGEFSKQIDEELTLRLFDGVAKDKEDLDIIEFLDGTIDFDLLIGGEIEAFDGSLSYCEVCSSSDEPLEIEF